MNIIVLTPVRLLGDGIAACVSPRPEMFVCAIVSDLAALSEALTTTQADIVLVDVTQGVDLYDIRSIALEFPDVSLVALGLTEQRQNVIRCGRAGFTGYVAREATVDALCESLSDVIHGRISCSAEISCGLLRALFREDMLLNEGCADLGLTPREGDVLQLIGQGLSNKEIARELALSVATVKHHVHNILGKLKTPRRAQAMRRVRDAPWLVSSGQEQRKRKSA